MKALAVFPSSREVRLIDHPEPAIARPTEVKLRILDAGICGTDREITLFQHGTPPVNSPHLIIGHEALSMTPATPLSCEAESRALSR